MHISQSSRTRTSVALLLFAVALTLASVASALDSNAPASARTASRPKGVRLMQPTYRVVAGLDGEIYPVFANYASLRQPRLREWGVVSVTVSNPTTQPVRQRIAVKIDGWSDQEIQMAEVAAGEVRTLLFAPTFLPRLYRNREIVAATATVSVTDISGELLYSATEPVRLRSADDIFWGEEFRNARYIASWVTPHDPEVERVLARAKETMPGRRLPGYESNKDAVEQEKMTMLQARAIYKALQQRGISYVKSSMTFGANQAWTERVRTPNESIQQASANCIDGVVMYASLFENLGMEPVVVLVPGHAYVGVRVAQGSKKLLLIETALTGRAPFETAVRSAQRALAAVAEKDVIRINVEDARDFGIFPMPTATLADAETETASAKTSKVR